MPLQPGWREHVVTRRLLRDLVVAHDLPQASRGGLAGRTPGAVDGIANLWLAGDWVGPTGMLPTRRSRARAPRRAPRRRARSARGGMSDAMSTRRALARISRVSSATSAASCSACATA